ncbi:AlbA family DNA-binding domain-containing protein [Marinifilum caeruleilacunae]|uniref:ATP-binding protein n=1 Tax=Marinifilum caeruleilacunae TaxID=2499076 RepID=A0ABX1WSV6_9BACT|nr:RNA-binding domain-containing protein [Marinifilum caeruleilacunae]NOU59184.1 ATP-binding protein [Marinifilum caeruleilacunae]
MVHYIEKLIREGEHQQQDFKFCITDSRKIAKSLSAFANTDGGRLLIGVKDNGKIAGAQVNEEFHMIQAAAEMYSKPKIEFESKVWTVNGKNVLEITIQPSEDMPHYAQSEDGKWLAYLRKDDENKLANRILLEVWKRKSKPTGTYLVYTETEKMLLDYLKNNESISLNQFFKLAKISRYKAERILVKLICWEVLEPKFEETGTTYMLKQVESNTF